MEQPEIRNPYNYDSDALSEATGLECKDESLCEQQFVEESDINYIAERFMRTGEAPTLLDLPQSGDFEGIFDFQSAMNLIQHAKLEFASLPAKVRARFQNDPAELLAFVNDVDNYDEAVKLGFIPKRDTTETPNETGTRSTTQAATQTTPGNTGTQAGGENAPATSKPG